jgi:hypothetical protein
MTGAPSFPITNLPRGSRLRADGSEQMANNQQPQPDHSPTPPLLHSSTPPLLHSSTTPLLHFSTSPLSSPPPASNIPSRVVFGPRRGQNHLPAGAPARARRHPKSGHCESVKTVGRRMPEKPGRNPEKLGRLPRKEGGPAGGPQHA